MSKQCIGGEVRLPSGATVPLSPAVRAGDFIYLSGQIAFDDDYNIVGDDVAAQTDHIFSRIEAVLGQAGGGLQDIVKVTAWLTRAEDFAAFNRAYANYFPTDPPARSTVRAELMAPGLLVEIEAVAYQPEQG